jgi:hypothetical protein
MLYTCSAQQRHREGNNSWPERHRHLQTQLALVLQGVHSLYFNHSHTSILPVSYRSYSENVSFQLAGNGSTGMSRVAYLSSLHPKSTFFIASLGRFGSFL